MTSETPSTEGRLGRLEGRFEEQADKYKGLAHTVAELRDDMEEKFSAMHSHMQNLQTGLSGEIRDLAGVLSVSQRTPWGVVWAGAGVVMAFTIAIGGLFTWQLQAELSRQAEITIQMQNKMDGLLIREGAMGTRIEALTDQTAREVFRIDEKIEGGGKALDRRLLGLSARLNSLETRSD